MARRPMIHAGGYSRIDSVTTCSTNGQVRQVLDASASRPPRTRSTSSCSCASTSGAPLSRYQVHDERIGGGLVPGQKDRHRLVAHLTVGHPAAVAFLVLRHQQHGQQIAAIAGRLAPLGDQAVDDRVELGSSPSASGGTTAAADAPARRTTAASSSRRNRARSSATGRRVARATRRRLPNSVWPTTASVSRIISCATSIVPPSVQPRCTRSAYAGHHRRVRRRCRSR